MDIFGVRVDAITHESLAVQLRTWLAGGEAHVIATPNAEMLVEARRHPAFAALLNAADLNLPDTVSLQYAALALYGSAIERHPGVDTLELLADQCARDQKRLVLFGGGAGSAEAAAQALRQRYVGLDVRAFNPGRIEHVHYQVFVPTDVLDHLERLQPDVLAVALGAGKQEGFLAYAVPRLKGVKIGIGVGGAFEMIAGALPRAPQWMQQRGLEWLWRLRLEPKRLGRIFTAAVIFPSLVALDTLRRRRFMAGCKAVFSRLFRPS